MCRRWFGLSVALPFQQFGKLTFSSSASSARHTGITANRFWPPTPPQLHDAIVRGWAIGPRIVDAGTSMSTTSGHMDDTLGVREEFHEILRASGSTCDGPDDCRRAVRRQVARGVDVIKIATTGGVNSRIGLGLGAQMTEAEARAIVETARLYGRRVAVHAHGTDGINLALRVGANSIEHGTLIVHLGMSGHLRVLPAGIPPEKHDHFDMMVEGADGRHVRERDGTRTIRGGERRLRARALEALLERVPRLALGTAPEPLRRCCAAVAARVGELGLGARGLRHAGFSARPAQNCTPRINRKVCAFARRSRTPSVTPS